MTADLLVMLFEVSLRSLAVGTIVAGLLRALRVRSSSARHAALTCVMCGMLLMPVLQRSVPGIVVPIPRWQSEASATFRPQAEGPARDAGVSQAAAAPAPSRVTAALEAKSGSLEAVAAPIRETHWLTAPSWSTSLVVVYSLGVLLLLGRLLLGSRAARRLAVASRPITLSGSNACVDRTGHHVRVFESSFVAAPVTLGIFVPVIVLPSTWRSWPAWNLRAVLAHERAHVRRRDPLIGFIARLNCCVFWFHPLAWWLQRELAASAEHASDDQAVTEVGEVERYARVLLEMARTVSLRGSRLSWHGVGMDGSGLLGARIDRLLRGDLLRALSRRHKILVTSCCIAAVVLVGSCRQGPAPLVPLADDPQVVARLARQEAEREFVKAAQAMTPQQVADLDALWKKNPDDLDVLKKLLTFYRHDFSGKKNPDQDRIIAARRPYILWLIEHHPESELAGSWVARIFATPLDALPDPVGYAEGKRLWLADAAKPNVSTAILSNAAYFFEVNDKPLAEQMLLRAQGLDSKGQWPSRLGRLYALVVMGSNASMPLNVVRYTSLTDSRSAYAQAIRAKLDASRDDVLLSTAAQYLIFSTQFFLQKRGEIDFDPTALGKSYLERVLEVNPQSVRARAQLIQIALRDRHDRIWATLRREPKVPEEHSLSRLSEVDRFAILPLLAQRENSGNQQDQDAAKAARHRSRAYAQEALALAPKFVSSPDYSMAVFDANMTLSTLAMWEGDKKTAVEYMRAASMVPASEELAYTGGIAARRPIAYLLKYGERESVIEYLERMAKINVLEKEHLLESAATIRRGQAPSFYVAQIKN